MIVYDRTTAPPIATHTHNTPTITSLDLTLTTSTMVVTSVASHIILNPIEGNIGSGKSTTIGNVASYCADVKNRKPGEIVVDVITEYEVVDQKILAEFYKDPKGKCYELQCSTRDARKRTIESVAERISTYTYDPEGPVVLIMLDRTCIGDFILAYVNHIKGTMTDDQMSRLMETTVFGRLGDIGRSVEMFAGLKNRLKDDRIKFTVSINFFTEKPKMCKKRVEQVRGNACEQDIPLDYYEAVHHAHKLAFSILRSYLKHNPKHDDAVRAHMSRMSMYAVPKLYLTAVGCF